MLLNSNEVLFNHPVDFYSKRLINICELYLDRKVTSLEDDTSKEAKKRLNWLVFENKTNESIKSKILSVKLNNRLTDKVKEEILRYLTCIMTLLGEIGECLFIDTCMNNSLVNMKCINIATFENDVDVENGVIPYYDYIPFSTSLKKLFFISNDIIAAPLNPHYNPHDTQRDIGWCLRNNHLNQLQVYKEGEKNGNQIKYSDIAKLQIKVTTNCNNIEIDKYKFTPLVVFDLSNDGEYFKKQHSNRIIYTMREICDEAETEIEYYFKILAAYATGYIDHIDIKDFELSETPELQSIFSMPLHMLKSKSPDNYQKLMDLTYNHNHIYTLGV